MVLQQWADLTCTSHIRTCSAMHAQGADHGGGSTTTSPSPASTAEPVAAGRGPPSRSTSPPLPSAQTTSSAGPGEGGGATSTKTRSPDSAAGVASCHGSIKVLSKTCGCQSTAAQGLQCLCLSSLMGRGGRGRELTDLSQLPCVGIDSELRREVALPCSNCVTCAADGQGQDVVSQVTGQGTRQHAGSLQSAPVEATRAGPALAKGKRPPSCTAPTGPPQEIASPPLLCRQQAQRPPSQGARRCSPGQAPAGAPRGQCDPQPHPRPGGGSRGAPQVPQGPAPQGLHPAAGREAAGVTLCLRLRCGYKSRQPASLSLSKSGLGLGHFLAAGLAVAAACNQMKGVQHQVHSSR